MPAANMIGFVKDGLLIMTAVGGISTGFYNYVAKPVLNDTRLASLENKMSEIKPTVDDDHVKVAVLTSRLDELKDSQKQILNVVLDIKRKL